MNNEINIKIWNKNLIYLSEINFNKLTYIYIIDLDKYMIDDYILINIIIIINNTIMKSLFLKIK